MPFKVGLVSHSDHPSLSINGVQFINDDLTVENIIVDGRYRITGTNIIWLENYKNLLFAASERFTVTWNDLTGVSNPERLWWTDGGDHYVALNMATCADPLIIEVTGFSATTSSAGSLRAFLIGHAYNPLTFFNNVTFEIQDKDGTWHELSIKYNFFTTLITESLIEAGIGLLYPFTGLRITLSGKKVTSGSRWLHGAGLFAPRERPFPCYLNRIGDTMLGDLTPENDNSYDLGSSDKRWANIYAVNVYTGDITFENKWRLIEGEKVGINHPLVLVSPDGKMYKITLDEVR